MKMKRPPKRRWLEISRLTGYWWINAGSFCLYCKNLNYFPRLISERRGLRRTLQLGHWLLGFDRRWR